ncbi:MAG: hypothetical protein KHZ24_01760 [Coriobacteriia bacterium]|nr:hypothetical protein [Coriobacteriia bacterium]
MLDKLSELRARWTDPSRKRLPSWAHLIILVVIAVLLEVFLFNFRHWESLGYEEQVLRDTPIRVTRADYSLGFSSLDTKIHNVKVEVASSTSNDNSSVWVSYAVTDEGNSEPYYLPVAQLHPDNERSEVQSVFTYGNIKSLRVSFPGDVWGGVDGRTLVASNSFPITVNSISINAEVPFAFSFLRLSLTFLALCVVWFLRPNGALGRIPALSTGWGARAIRGGVLAVVLVLLFVYWTSFPKWVAIATANYNADEFSGRTGELYEVFDQPDTATNEYAKLAQAFAAGQLDLLQEPPQWLIDMDNPYDYGARSEESTHHLRGYLWDTAYYDGQYYVYFGVLPVLVFYLPYYLLTGLTFPNSVAVLIPTLLFVVGLYSLMRALVRYRFTKTSLGTFLLVFLGILCASQLLVGLGRPGLYNVPVSFARCLSVWGLCLWYRGWCKGSPVRLAGGSLCIALISACRPQLLILIPLMFVILFLIVRSKDMPRQQKITWSAWLLVPVVVVAAGVMWYNWARFGSVTDFGAAYNLTYNDMTHRGHSIVRMLEGAYYYLFNPPYVVSTFPFMHMANVYPGFSGTTTYEPMLGGAFLLFPMLWSLVMLGSVRKGPHADRPVFWMAGYLFAAAVILVLFDTEGAGILLRYTQDFGFIIGLAAGLVFLHHLGGAGVEAVCAPALASCEEETPTADAGTPAALEAPVESGALVAKPRRGWAIALFATVVASLLFTMLIMIAMHDPTGDLSTGGSYPPLWEYLRQTFMWWL